MPPKKGMSPGRPSETSAPTAPTWAMASTSSTPGTTGYAGKWPVKNGSSGEGHQRPTVRTSGTISSDLVHQEERRAVRDDLVGPGHRVTGRPSGGLGHDARAARNLVGVSLGLTLYQASWIFPLAPTRKDERMIPM